MLSLVRLHQNGAAYGAADNFEAMIWGAIVVLALMIPLIAVVLDSHLGRALAQRLEPGRNTPDDAVTRRVTQLEAEVDRLNGELLRLNEETVFLHKLLESKPAAHAELPPGEQTR